MRGSLKNIQFDCRICLKLGFALLLLPVRWVLCWLVAILVHEMFHYVAILVTGGRIYRVNFTANGVTMESDITGNRREFACAMAGPLGSLLLTLLINKAPILGACALVQFFVNLLPIYPLDGGRALSCLLFRIAPKFRPDIMRTISFAFRALLLLLGIYLSFIKSLGLLPVISAAMIVARNINIPCKRSWKRVQ